MRLAFSKLAPGRGMSTALDGNGQDFADVFEASNRRRRCQGW